MIWQLGNEVRLGFEHDATVGQTLKRGVEIVHLVVDDGTLTRMRLGWAIEHEPNTATIEEAEPGRCLKEKPHSEDVPIERDRPFQITHRNGDLSYRA